MQLQAGLDSLSQVSLPCATIGLDSVGALIITYTILGVPYYIYSIMGPETLFNSN